MQSDVEVLQQIDQWSVRSAALSNGGEVMPPFFSITTAPEQLAVDLSNLPQWVSWYSVATRMRRRSRRQAPHDARNECESQYCKSVAHATRITHRLSASPMTIADRTIKHWSASRAWVGRGDDDAGSSLIPLAMKVRCGDRRFAWRIDHELITAEFSFVNIGMLMTPAKSQQARLDRRSNVTRLSAATSLGDFAHVSKAALYPEGMGGRDIMKILSHRGYWKEPGEKNSVAAFTRSLSHGFGLETDIRDHDGRLVISHDVPIGGELELNQLLQRFQNQHLTLALNIKADGLADLIQSAMNACNIEDWFAFDMSIPDMRNCLDHNIPVFARVSDVEKSPPWINEVAGIWFDSFSRDSYDCERVASFLRDGKQVCVVSPELHNWPYLAVWQELRRLSEQQRLMICTDYPEKARQFFMKESMKRHDKSNYL